MSDQFEAQIIVLKGAETVRYELSREETLMGRAATCDIPIESNMVSFKHARILQCATRYSLEDLSSVNGTFVNGRRITEPTELKDDDRIKLGPVLMLFSLSSNPTARRPDSQHPTAPAEHGASIPDDNGMTGLSAAVRYSVSSGFDNHQAKSERKLRAIVEITQALAGTADPDLLLNRILESLFRVFPQIDRGVILLKDSATGRMIPRTIRHRAPGEDQRVVLPRSIVSHVLEKRQGIFSTDDVDADNPGESVANFRSHSMMCMPMLGLSGEPIGLIHVETNRLTGKFNSDDLDLLATIAGQATVYYEAVQRG